MPDPLQGLELERRWVTDKRWGGVARTYRAQDVIRLQGSLPVEHTVARHGARRLWEMLEEPGHLTALGAMTGGQAVQMVKAGLRAIYVSGWQVAADANLAGQTYPDLGLYPANSVPALVRRIHLALERADQAHKAEGRNGVEWFAPLVADGEAGFGGPLNAFETMKAMIEAGAAGVHFEDQASGERRGGPYGGKVLVPVRQFLRTLTAARLAADVCDVPTLLVARTDARSGMFLTSEIDECDRPFCTGERSPEGYHRVRGGLRMAIERGLAYAPFADLLWCESAVPDLAEAKAFAEAIREEFPCKLLAYDFSPGFQGRRQIGDAAISRFQRELSAMGYRFQFIALAGFHALNLSMFDLAKGIDREEAAAYAKLQRRECAMEGDGYTALNHDRETGAAYYDQVLRTVTAGEAAMCAAAEDAPALAGARRAG